MRRAAQASSAAALLFVCGVFSRLQAHFWRAELLVAHDNTWRDFQVYREIGLGLLPLQGPSSSIGGHHGYLAYWIFGLWTWLLPGYRSLQILGALVLLASAAFSWLIARRLASGAAALLAAGCYLCASPALFTVYPNHIIFMSLGTGMAVYGLLRAREGRRWAWLCAAGVVLTMGSHSYGFALLLEILALGRLFALGARGRAAWSLVALYLFPAVAVCLLEGWGVGRQTQGIWHALGGMEPGLNLRAMAFLHFREEPASAWQYAEMAFGACAWALAWAERKDAPARAVLAFYAANFVLFLFYKYDGQYHLPMFALLPAVLAMGLDAAWSRRRELGLAAFLALGALQAHAAMAKASFVSSYEAEPGSPLQSISGELSAVEALGSLKVGETELLRRGRFVPLSESRKFYYLYRLFSRSLAAPEAGGRCIEIGADDRVSATPVSPAGCGANILPHDGGAIWYWDLRSSRAVRL